MSEEVLKKVIDLGKLNYPLSKCLNILQLNEADRKAFEKQFNDPKSEVGRNYQIGIDLADFELDSKMFQLAKSGDLKAVSMFDARRREYERKKEKERTTANADHTNNDTKKTLATRTESPRTASQPKPAAV